MNDHEPAHVHFGVKGGAQAQMAIDDEELLKGSLPRAVQREARD
ncbi:MAG: DUF4160 domain-containing protein [Alphaproteobacteria bacterium]|nr:DUF4160 domain-containing protein [Alphaproteobacteria bacterium]